MKIRPSWLLSVILCLALIGLPTATAAAAAPSNDDFADAEVLTGATPSVLGSNVDATLEDGEPDHAGASGEHSVWYRWTAPETLPVTLSLCDSDFDTALAVYEGGSPAALIEVASNDDSNKCFPQSELALAAEAGTTYQIAVDGSWGDMGSFVLEFSDRRPTNDAFASAAPLNGYLANGSGTNQDATTEEGEPVAGPDPAGQTIWFRWVASAGGVAAIDTCRSNFDTLLAVYVGDVLTTLDRAAEGDDECGRQSRVTFFAAKGTSYAIQIDGSGDFDPAGKVKLRVGQSQPGLYSGRTEFIDREPINFRLSSDGRSIMNLTVRTTLDCTSGGYIVGELRVKKLVFDPISVRKGKDGAIFSRTAKIKFTGGGTLTVAVDGSLIAPDRARGKMRPTARFPGVSCKHWLGSVKWTARN